MVKKIRFLNLTQKDKMIYLIYELEVKYFRIIFLDNPSAKSFIDSWLKGIYGESILPIDLL